MAPGLDHSNALYLLRLDSQDPTTHSDRKFRDVLPCARILHAVGDFTDGRCRMCLVRRPGAERGDRLRGRAHSRPASDDEKLKMCFGPPLGIYYLGNGGEVNLWAPLAGNNFWHPFTPSSSWMEDGDSRGARPRGRAKSNSTTQEQDDNRKRAPASVCTKRARLMLAVAARRDEDAGVCVNIVW